MNSQRPFNPMFVIVPVLIGLGLIVSVLTGGGNRLGLFFRNLLVLSFMAGFLFPRGMLAMWLVLCGYTDFFKRLMVVFGSVSMRDLYNVLGIPPATLAGITVAVISGAALRQITVSKAHWRLFYVACALIVVSLLFAVRTNSGSASGIIPAIANDGVYALLIFVTPVLYHDSKDVVRLIKLLLWAYLPVALYGVYQRVCGYNDFEVAYLKTGLSLEIKQLLSDEVRAFSTLNSSTALSTVCGLLCILSLVLTMTPRRNGEGNILGRWTAYTFVGIYVLGLLASTSRSALAMIVVGLAGFFAFRSSRGTRMLYAGLAVSFVALVFFAGAILDNLDNFQLWLDQQVGGGSYASQMTRVGTYSDRLSGFSNLARNPDVYTLFGYGPGRGYDERDPLHAHDLLSNVLVTHGLVPLLAMMFAGGYLLSRLHRQVFQIGDRQHRLLAAGLLSATISFFALSVMSGSVLSVFPVNVMMWLCVGLLMVVFQDEARAAAAGTVLDPLPAASPPTAPAPRVVHRFRRSGYSTSRGSL